MERTEVLLIDSDIRRRAGISHSLTNMASFVIPLEHYSELTQCWPKNAIILVEDAGSTVESLCRLMAMHNKDLPFVAFSADASPARRSAALMKGAGAYLPWPCSAEELKSTLLSVIASHAARTGSLVGNEAPASGFPQFSPAVTAPPVDSRLKAMTELWRQTSDQGAAGAPDHQPGAYAE